ncbi:phosphopantetheine-binding protein [Actinokineospora sp. G85]|uniref:phosphopantetheine-binding protein n=1 Tax=Actinokineospora sp. G85 TaxID=3406626 RepID=UPI003C734434
MTDDTLPRVFALVERTLPDAGPVSDPDAELDALGLTSLKLVELLVALESEFGVSLPEELVAPETFRTPATIAEAVSALR